MTFEELCIANPHLGYAVSHYEPGDPVTLEIFDAGETFTFMGATLQEAVDKAFPPVPVANVFA